MTRPTPPWPVRAGLVYHRRARSTGTLVSVYNSAEAHLDTDDGVNPWSTVCEDHAEFCSHRTRALAFSHAPHPLDWCAGCQEAAKQGTTS